MSLAVQSRAVRALPTIAAAVKPASLSVRHLRAADGTLNAFDHNRVSASSWRAVAHGRDVGVRQSQMSEESIPSFFARAMARRSAAASRFACALRASRTTARITIGRSRANSSSRETCPKVPRELFVSRNMPSGRWGAMAVVSIILTVATGPCSAQRGAGARCCRCAQPDSAG